MGFYLRMKIRKYAQSRRCDQTRDITEPIYLLLCMPSEATTFDFNVSHVRHSRNYITIPLCDAHHGGEMRHASVPAALKNAWR